MELCPPLVRTLLGFIYRKKVDEKESHLAQAEGHVTKVVKDDVGHAGSQQESCRGTCTDPVTPPRARAARGRVAWVRTPQRGIA